MCACARTFRSALRFLGIPRKRSAFCRKHRFLKSAEHKLIYRRPLFSLIIALARFRFNCVSNNCVLRAACARGSLYWLGLNIFNHQSNCSICHTTADSFGDYQVGCSGNGDRIFRHNSIRDAIISAAQSAALVPRKVFPSLIPDRQCRPADIFLPHWDRGLPAALDVSVISTLQQRTLIGAA